MQSLQEKAEQLKGEQLKLKLTINEKNTANILCCLFSNTATTNYSIEDPRVEALLRRPEEDIPDPSKLQALKPLILPSGAQHAKRYDNNNGTRQILQSHELPDDGIDYELLGKDRLKCTQAELDQIRRERNRMHAKRTRDRKRLFMEEMSEICKVLEEENLILQRHLDELSCDMNKASIKEIEREENSSSTLNMVSPTLTPTIAPTATATQQSTDNLEGSNEGKSKMSLTSQDGASFDQMKSLLDAAGVFDLSIGINKTTVSVNKTYLKNKYNSSCAVSVSSAESSRPLKKRRRVLPSAYFSDEDGRYD